jgi:hypothetical protein
MIRIWETLTGFGRWWALWAEYAASQYSSVSPPHLIDLIAHFLPLLPVLLTMRTYIRGIKILTNILTKKLAVTSSLLRVDGRTNCRGEKSNELN